VNKEMFASSSSKVQSGSRPDSNEINAEIYQPTAIPDNLSIHKNTAESVRPARLEDKMDTSNIRSVSQLEDLTEQLKDDRSQTQMEILSRERDKETVDPEYTLSQAEGDGHELDSCATASSVRKIAFLDKPQNTYQPQNNHEQSEAVCLRSVSPATSSLRSSFRADSNEMKGVGIGSNLALDRTTLNIEESSETEPAQLPELTDTVEVSNTISVWVSGSQHLTKLKDVFPRDQSGQLAADIPNSIIVTFLPRQVQPIMPTTIFACPFPNCALKVGMQADVAPNVTPYELISLLAMAHFPLIEKVLANVATPHNFYQVTEGNLVLQCHLCPVRFLLCDPTSIEEIYDSDTRTIRATKKQYDEVLSLYKSHYISHTMENGQQRLLSSAPNATSKSAESTQPETSRSDGTEASNSSKSNDITTSPAVSNSDGCTRQTESLIPTISSSAPEEIVTTSSSSNVSSPENLNAEEEPPFVAALDLVDSSNTGNNATATNATAAPTSSSHASNNKIESYPQHLLPPPPPYYHMEGLDHFSCPYNNCLYYTSIHHNFRFHRPRWPRSLSERQTQAAVELGDHYLRCHEFPIFHGTFEFTSELRNWSKHPCYEISKGDDGCFSCQKCDFNVFPSKEGRLAFESAEKKFNLHYFSHIYSADNLKLADTVLTVPNKKSPQYTSKMSPVSEVKCTECEFVSRRDPKWIRRHPHFVVRYMKTQLLKHYKTAHELETLPTTLCFYQPMSKEESKARTIQKADTSISVTIAKVKCTLCEFVLRMKFTWNRNSVKDITRRMISVMRAHFWKIHNRIGLPKEMKIYVRPHKTLPVLKTILQSNKPSPGSSDVTPNLVNLACPHLNCQFLVKIDPEGPCNGRRKPIPDRQTKALMQVGDHHLRVHEFPCFQSLPKSSYIEPFRLYNWSNHPCYKTKTRKGSNGYFRCHKCDFKVYPHCYGSRAFLTAQRTFSYHYISHIFPTRPVMPLPNRTVVLSTEAKGQDVPKPGNRVLKVLHRLKLQRMAISEIKCTECEFVVRQLDRWKVRKQGDTAMRMRRRLTTHYKIAHQMDSLPSGLNFYRRVSEEEAKTHQREYFCTRIYKYRKKTALSSIQCTLCPFVLNKDPIWNVELPGIEIAKRMRDRMEAHYKVVHEQEELPNELKFFLPMPQKELISKTLNKDTTPPETE
jgi:hypothetical protein